MVETRLPSKLVPAVSNRHDLKCGRFGSGQWMNWKKPCLCWALHVPIWAVTFAFAMNDMNWQRLLERMGRSSRVWFGTTVRVSENMSQQIAEDKHRPVSRGGKELLAFTDGVDPPTGPIVAQIGSNNACQMGRGGGVPPFKDCHPRVLRSLHTLLYIHP